MRTIWDVLEDMEKILFPGEFGLGTETASFPENDKGAWEALGKLTKELQDEMLEVQSDLLHIMNRIPTDN